VPAKKEVLLPHFRSDLQDSRYRDTGAKRLLAALAMPIFWCLNRPIFRRYNEACFNIALRLNGFAIGFRGRYGLTYPEEAFLQQFLPKVKSGVILDVGANHGTYSRFVSRLRPDLELLAFEPHPRSFSLLQQNTSRQNVSLFNLALSDQSGPMRIFDFASEDGSTQASLSKEAVQFFEADTVEYEINCTTLDEFCEMQRIGHIAFLKIDTEGFDIKVLRGARQMLSRGHIDVIQFEFIPACIVLRVSMRDFFEILEGYKLYRLCVGGALMPLTYNVKMCEIYVVQNIIAIRDAFKF
jgi:FkbM family methyltransferase